MVGEVHHAEQERSQRRCHPLRIGAEAGDQAQGEGDKVVGHLLLADLRRPEADQRQHPEEAQAQAGPHAHRGQHAGQDEDTHIEPDEGQRHVAASVPREVEAIGQHGDGDQVEGDGGDVRHGPELYSPHL
jgi:hypothetical protein